MRRFSILQMVLPAAMALLLPLGELHCTCMGSPRHAARIASSAGRGCCGPSGRSAAEHASHHRQDPNACGCASMIAGLVPAVVAVSPESPTVAPLAVPVVPLVIAPVSSPIKTAVALDVGSPPLPDDPGAHGLRAPPLFA